MHRAAQRYRKVLKIPANALLLHRDIDRGLCGPRKMISERDFRMHPVENRLNARPAWRRVPEQLPRQIGKPVDFAIAAGKQKLNHIGRQLFNRMLHRIPRHRIGFARVLNQRGIVKPQCPLRRSEAQASISETVVIFFGRHLG